VLTQIIINKVQDVLAQIMRQFFSIKGQGQKIGVLAQITTNNSTTTERQVKVS